MDNIPGHVLNELWEACAASVSTADALRMVARHHTERAEHLEEARTRGWKSAAAELRTVAAHLEQYADAFGAFSSDPMMADPAPAPAEPAPRCAAFRKLDAADPVVCGKERGHDGEHAGFVDNGVTETWPRQHSGELCNLPMTQDDTDVRCTKPLGHDGDHVGPDSSGVEWAWRYGQQAVQASAQQVCGDYDSSGGNCARPIGHAGLHANFATQLAWAVGYVTPGTAPKVPIGRDELGDAAYDAIMADAPQQAVDPAVGVPSERAADEYPNQCPSVNVITDDRCMLPGTPPHTGRHTGRHGHWVDIVAVDPTPDSLDAVSIAQSDGTTLTLSQQVDAQRVALAMPAPIAATITINEQAVQAAGIAAAAAYTSPAAVMVAEIKEEVTATVNNFTGQVPDPAAFAPGAFANAFGMAIGGSTPGAAPAVPPAPWFMPHEVPGTPRERYSVSSVEAMEDCGLKFRLKYRDKIADTSVGWAAVGGKAVHGVCQHVEAAYLESAGAQYSITDALQLERDMVALWEPTFAAEIVKTERESGIPSAHWRASNSGKEDRAWWNVNGPKMVAQYAKWRIGFLSRGWSLLRQPPVQSTAPDGTTVLALGAPAIEVEWNTPIAGVPMTGFLDTAWISGDRDEIRIIDYKSGSREGSEFQQRTYGAAVRALGLADGVKVTASFYEARKGSESVPMDLTPDDDAEIAYRVNTAAAMDRANLFAPRPSTFCGGCPVKAACPVASKR